MAIRMTSASLSTPFSYISKLDPAVDLDIEDFEEAWKRYRDGAPGAEPPLKPGLEATVWELVPVTDSRQRGQLQGIYDDQGRSAWLIAYAASGIASASNLLDEHGKKMKIRRFVVDGFEAVDPGQLGLIPAEVLIEIGAVLVTHETPEKN